MFSFRTLKAKIKSKTKNVIVPLSDKSGILTQAIRTCLQYSTKPLFQCSQSETSRPLPIPLTWNGIECLEIGNMQEQGEQNYLASCTSRQQVKGLTNPPWRHQIYCKILHSLFKMFTKFIAHLKITDVYWQVNVILIHRQSFTDEWLLPILWEMVVLSLIT